MGLLKPICGLFSVFLGPLGPILRLFGQFLGIQAYSGGPSLDFGHIGPIFGLYWAYFGGLGLDFGPISGVWAWILAILGNLGLFGPISGYWAWILGLFRGSEFGLFSGTRACISGIWAWTLAILGLFRRVGAWIWAYFGGLDLGLFGPISGVWAWILAILGQFLAIFGDQGMDLGSSFDSFIIKCISKIQTIIHVMHL